jgi:drug/metabolite transporter (DMT)-like permease
MATQDWVALFALSLLWGGSFLFAKVAVAEIPPLTLVLLRVALAAGVLWLVIALVRPALPAFRQIAPVVLVMGLINNVVPFGLIFWGQTTIGAGLASILNATTPVFAALVAHAFTADEKLSARKLAGIAVAFGGVVLLVGPSALDGLDRSVVAQIACLGAAVSYGFAAVWGRRIGRMGVTPLVGATGQLTASTLMLAPLVALLDRPWALPMPSAVVWANVVTLAVASTAFAYLLFFRLLARAGATNAAAVTFVIPASAIALGALVLGERLAALQAVGFGVILIGLVVLDGRLLRRLTGSGRAA